MNLSITEVKSVLDAGNKEASSKMLGEFMATDTGFLNIESLMAIRRIATNVNTYSQFVAGKQVVSGSLFYKDKMYTFARSAA